MPIDRWEPAIVVAKTADEVERRMDRAVIFLRDEVKRLINVGNPTGLEPSAPGEPPRKVTSRLFQSIAKAVVRLPKEIIGAYGSNVVYALRLELGFIGVDRLGRRYNQLPRPYIRRALMENKKRVAEFFR